MKSKRLAQLRERSDTEMELENYTIQHISTIPDVPLVPFIPFPDGIIKASIYANKPTAKLSYELPFAYHEFKILCLIAVFKHEGISFKKICNQSSILYEYCEHHEGFLIKYEIDDTENFPKVVIMEMTIQITETVIEKIPKFKAIPA